MTPLRFRPESRALLLVMAVALVLRLAVVGVQAGRPLGGDELSYDDVAWNVATGHGYQSGRTEAERRPTAARGPAYVLALAGFYATFGHRPTAPLVAQAILDALSVAIVYALAQCWFRSRAVALVAAGLYAVYPPFILISGLLLTETFTNFTILLMVWLFTVYVERRDVRALVASATTLGVCALSKPQLAPVGVVLCLAAAPRLGFVATLRAIALTIATVLVVMSPWIMRNAVVFHAFVPGVSMGGLGLWLGAGPIDGRTIGGLDAPGVPDSLRTLIGGMTELEAARWGAAEARRIILADPEHYAWLTVKKTVRLWFNLGFDVIRPSRASLVLAFANLIAIALAMIGARAGAPTPPASRLLVLLALLWTVVNVPFFTVVRYAYPYYAVLFVFTAAGIVALVRPRALGRA